MEKNPIEESIPQLPDLFKRCGRCYGSKVEAPESPRGGEPCDRCYGAGEVIPLEGTRIAAVFHAIERARATKERWGRL